MATTLFIAALSFLVIVILLYIASLIARRRLRRSKYGHTFDFSKIPKKKIVPKD